MNSPLLVFAHPLEAAAFQDLDTPKLITDIGLVNASVRLSRTLSRGGVSRVIVLGTAGLLSEGGDLDQIYRISSTFQHDLALRSHEYFLPKLSFSAEMPSACIASGDTFVRDNEHRLQLASLGAQLVDMETFGYAAAAATFGIPLVVFKTPTDNADSAASPLEWEETALRKSTLLRQFYDAYLA